ncbi:hypothetical protein [Shimia ponticola]|uniref:hypothetical protein n=1 Tax=Shimia ponticola TaxID=2582893 RepID=UPI0011BD5432|nr:hypothetical protein [Shimia ponticola]
MLMTLPACSSIGVSGEAWTVALAPRVDALTIAIAENRDCIPDAVLKAAGELVLTYDAIAFAECA